MVFCFIMTAVFGLPGLFNLTTRRQWRFYKLFLLAMDNYIRCSHDANVRSPATVTLTKLENGVSCYSRCYEILNWKLRGEQLDPYLTHLGEFAQHIRFKIHKARVNRFSLAGVGVELLDHKRLLSGFVQICALRFHPQHEYVLIHDYEKRCVRSQRKTLKTKGEGKLEL